MSLRDTSLISSKQAPDFESFIAFPWNFTGYLIVRELHYYKKKNLSIPHLNPI